MLRCFTNVVSNNTTRAARTHKDSLACVGIVPEKPLFWYARSVVFSVGNWSADVVVVAG